MRNASDENEIFAITADQLYKLLSILSQGGEEDSAESRTFTLGLDRQIYAYVRVDISEKPLEPFENSMVISILSESALAVENYRNAKEKEEAALLAKNEQLRADMLRSISHDLRTSLSSLKKCRESPDPYIYHTKYMGKQPGE